MHVTVQRPWGSFTVLEQAPGFKIKRIEVLPGGRLSLQRHKYRSEHWVVLSGEATVTSEANVVTLRSNESTYIQIGSMHRLENRGEAVLQIIEVQVGSCVEDDIERFDDQYGRGKASPSFNGTMPKVALITGITGQDGAFLAEFLLSKGYVVHGIKRRTSLFNTDRIDHLYRDTHETDVRLFAPWRPDGLNECHAGHPAGPAGRNLQFGCASHVGVSFEEPEYTANSDALGTCSVLEAIRILGLNGTTRFYQASTSELFGNAQESPQKETTPFYPRSPYGVAKLYAYWITVNYREAYGLFAPQRASSSITNPP